MGEQVVASATTVALAIVALATLAVLVSKNANTTGVIGASSTGFSRALGAATAPITGGGLIGGGYNSAGYID